MSLALSVALGCIWLTSALSCYYSEVLGRKNFLAWPIFIRYNSPVIIIIPIQSLRESMERLISLLKFEEGNPSKYKLCLFSMASGIVFSIIACLLSYAVQIHQLPGCPTFEGQPGRLVTAEIDTSPFLWKLPCLLGQDTLRKPPQLAGDEAAYNQVLEHWDFNAFTGHLISRIPNQSVDVELRLKCCYGLFHWSCGVLHQPVGVGKRDQPGRTPEKVHNAYPDIENPVKYAIGFLILTVLTVVFCFFCFWFVFALLLPYAVGFCSALVARK